MLRIALFCGARVEYTVRNEVEICVTDFAYLAWIVSECRIP